MLETLKKNKGLIDNDRNGISMRDIKEFDAKITQYNNELAISRKFAPETAALARELHQHGKMIDQNHDGKFSRNELQHFYAQTKNDFVETYCRRKAGTPDPRMGDCKILSGLQVVQMVEK